MVQRPPRPASAAPKPASVPRRYDMVTMFVVMTVYAVVLALLRLVGTPPLAQAILIGFVTVVGLGQSILFGGQQPRKASMVVGGGLACLSSLFMAFQWLPEVFRRSLNPLTAVMMFFGMALALVWQVAIGCLLGYLAGTLAAGVFFVSDGIRKRWSGGYGAIGPEGELFASVEPVDEPHRTGQPPETDEG